MLRPLIELLEVIGRVIEMLAPIEADPLHVAHDRLGVFDFLFGRIRIVEPEIAVPAVFVGDSEIEADRFRVADVQIAVRLRREPRYDGRMPAAPEVLLDNFPNKVRHKKVAVYNLPR
jgi:hypothetical protein